MNIKELKKLDEIFQYYLEYNDYKFQMKFLYQINKKVEVFETCSKFPYNVRVLIEKECDRFKHLQNFENKNC